jgi:UDP:flavonoid glycosyltransferase YjiC (YdhE family)
VRALLATLGSRGDVEPFVMLAEALAARGHAITLAVDDGYRELSSIARLPPAVDVVTLGALGPATLVDTVARAVSATSPLERSRVGYQGFIGHRREALERRMSELVTGHELVVVNEALAWPRAGRLPWPAPTAVVWYTPSPAADLRRLLEVPCLRLAALPAFSAPPDDEIRARLIYTGFWHRTTADALPGPVAAFLDAGTAPAFLTMGSMAGFDGRALAASFVGGTRAAGLRAIVQRGWARLEPPEGDDVLLVDEIDYGALFPRCAAVFMHGGTGTVGLALAARRPIAVIPLVEDQHAWARTLGAAPGSLGTLDPHRMSSADVARALSRLPEGRRAASAATIDAGSGLDVACAQLVAFARA